MTAFLPTVIATASILASIPWGATAESSGYSHYNYGGYNNNRGYNNYYGSSSASRYGGSNGYPSRYSGSYYNNQRYGSNPYKDYYGRYPSKSRSYSRYSSYDSYGRSSRYGSYDSYDSYDKSYGSHNSYDSYDSYDKSHSSYDDDHKNDDDAATYPPQKHSQPEVDGSFAVGRWLACDGFRILTADGDLFMYTESNCESENALPIVDGPVLLQNGILIQEETNPMASGLNRIYTLTLDWPAQCSYYYNTDPEEGLCPQLLADPPVGFGFVGNNRTVVRHLMEGHPSFIDPNRIQFSDSKSQVAVGVIEEEIIFAITDPDPPHDTDFFLCEKKAKGLACEFHVVDYMLTEFSPEPVEFVHKGSTYYVQDKDDCHCSWD